MATMTEAFEKLGMFYLGRERDEPGELVLYESRHLVTHGVCVGMTGSGKTGLCTVLLEEAAIDGVPAIIIDPKGDIANLLLTFPNLEATDFEPWVDPEAARRKGLTQAEYGAAEAEKWREGLAGWGQDGERIARLRQSSEFTIYTPGSSAGESVSLLTSFAAPPRRLRDDLDLLAERVSGTVTSLLSLMEVDADPLTSPEHILLSNILLHYWERGEDVDLAQLIGSIQEPPVRTIGVMDVDAFFPAKRRAALAMRLNSLLAAPSFAPWLRGAPMDIDGFLTSPGGRPKVSIFSIAHLSETERMFFVSLLLNHVVGWMRSQSGTSSLRAILYMDEIFGYLPPVAKPPSKKPLMTMLKQGRAFGLGVLLATQNPADIDYKALSNTGTWLLGRLQTERDRARVLDALESAANESGESTSRDAIDEVLRGLDSRQFVLHNVHEPSQPTVFESRWALSYLRGPLTRADIKQLSEAKGPAEPKAAELDTEMAEVEDEEIVSAPYVQPDVDTDPEPALTFDPPPVELPKIPARVSQTFVTASADLQRPAGVTLLYRPMVYGRATIEFVDGRRDLDTTRGCALLCGFQRGDSLIAWSRAVSVPRLGEERFAEVPEVPCSFHGLPDEAFVAKNYTQWKRDLIDHLYRTETFELLQCKDLRMTASPDETREAFYGRVRAQLRERRDVAIEKVRDKFRGRLDKAQDRVDRTASVVDEQSSQARQAQLNTALNVGTSLLGSLFGSSRRSTRRAVSGVSKAIKEQRDVSRAEARHTDALEAYAAVERDLQLAVDAVRAKNSVEHSPVDVVAIKPRKSTIAVSHFGLAWVPYWVAADGRKTRAVK